MPPDSRFTPGDRILVAQGSARGLVGAIAGPSKYNWTGDVMWRVALDGDPHEHNIRESFMVPEPSKGDEDVLASLRNTVSG